MCPSVNRDVTHALFFYLFRKFSCLYCVCLKGFLDTLRLDRGTSVKLLEWYEYMQLEQERDAILRCFQNVPFSDLQSLLLAVPYICCKVSCCSKAVQARWALKMLFGMLHVNYAVYWVNSYHIAGGARSVIANISFEERGKAMYM